MFPVSPPDIHLGLAHWTTMTPSKHDRNALGISSDGWLIQGKTLQNLRCVENMNSWRKKLNGIINSLKSKPNGTVNSRTAKQGEMRRFRHSCGSQWPLGRRSELNLSLPRFVVHLQSLLPATQTTSETLCKASERRWQGSSKQSGKRHALHGRHSSSRCLRNARGLTKNGTLVCENWKRNSSVCGLSWTMRSSSVIMMRKCDVKPNPRNPLNAMRRRGSN